MDSVTPTSIEMGGKVSPVVFRAAIYLVAFITGAIVMSFEMLGSRYLNPYFGNGIYTWAALISTVLAALTAGYFLGGVIADRTVSAAVLGAIVGVASVYLLALPSFADAILRFVLDNVDNVRLGSLCSALAIMFLPVMLLGVYSPFAVRLVLRATRRSGTVSGTVYGVSTAGSIAGTLGTTFFLIPAIGTHAITLWLGAVGAGCGLSLLTFDRMHLARKGVRSTAGLVLAVLLLGISRACADDLIDENVRAQMLKHSDGRVVHLETEYNDLFIDKQGSFLSLSSRYKGRPDYINSLVDLKDPDNMPVPYNRIMPVALAYPRDTKRILMIGLGAGSISTYLGRAMPEAQIDVVELDPGVIAAGKKYFGLRETDKVRFIESDGRVYLNRHKDAYDLILLDAFRELGVPFHMLTREFYTLVKEHLAPGGVVASNVVANTKLYLSTLVTLHTVFPTVDVYPAWSEPNETQAIAVAVPASRPAAESLMQRARVLQGEYRFRYPLPVLVGRRVTELYTEGADVLTDDFAPADLYRVTPIRVPKDP
ncbi:fused MFS/spermidine synthase [Bradyrhizobium sp. ARR65]|uniref:fused MFS/spermidine synthase n=1 Tax=Bradyrhizobium sp. ARR65 TaxID=1040989 RepID=UPI0006845CEF|nr:fused MFS/spermidine synthase [Bradyrhizobium sp. ARR65]